MSRLRRLIARLSAFCLPGRAERELARDLDAHLRILEEEYLERGSTIEEARLAARRRLGGVDSVKEQQRDARSFVWLEEMRRDLRQALRTLTRSPGFTAVAALTIALAIGSVVIVFSVVHAVAIRPLPYYRSDQLVRLVEMVAPEASPSGVGLRRVTDSLNVAELDELRRRAGTVTHIASYANSFMTLTDTGHTARLEGWRVEPPLFPMLGVQPLLGRAFDASDAVAGAPRVIILGHAAWQAYLGGRRDAVGESITLDNARYAVVGVMPPAFQFPMEFASRDFWVPLGLDLTSVEAREVRLPTVARLADDATAEMAAAEATFLLRALNGKASSYAFVRVQDEWVAPIERALQALTAAVALVFLVAAVNLSSLLLARTATRQREIAIRAALGGRRSRIVRLLLTESVLLAIVGGIGGVAVAFVGVHLLRTLAATMPRMDLGTFTAFPRLDEVAITAPVLLFTVAIALLTGLACGVGPALRHTRRLVDADALRQGVGSTPSPSAAWGQRPGGLLMVAQIALATVLLVGGGLLVRSYLKLTQVDIGYEPSRVLTFQVALPSGKYQGPSLERFAEELVSRTGSLVGVTAAAYTPLLPMVTLLEHSATFRRTSAMPPSRSAPGDDLRGVSADYFRVMGIDVVAGRALDPADRAGSRRVVVINRAMARRHFPGEDPIGKTAYLQRLTEPWEVVGVVETSGNWAQPTSRSPRRSWIRGSGPGWRRDSAFCSTTPCASIRASMSTR